MTDLNALKAVLAGKVERDDKGPRLSRKTYEEALPENMTMADIKRMEHHNGMYRAASMAVLGNVAIDDMTADEKLEHVDLVAEYSASSTLEARVYRNNRTGKGEKAKDSFGHSTPVIRMGDEPDFLDAVEGIGKRAKDLWGK